MTAPNGMATSAVGRIVTLAMNQACWMNSRTWNGRLGSQPRRTSRREGEQVAAGRQRAGRRELAVEHAAGAFGSVGRRHDRPAAAAGARSPAVSAPAGRGSSAPGLAALACERPRAATCGSPPGRPRGQRRAASARTRSCRRRDGLALAAARRSAASCGGHGLAAAGALRARRRCAVAAAWPRAPPVSAATCAASFSSLMPIGPSRRPLRNCLTTGSSLVSSILARAEHDQVRGGTAGRGCPARCARCRCRA